MPHSVYQHILGGLLGQAFGDAFAMPALLRPQETWKFYGGWLTAFHPGAAGHPAHEGLPAARDADAVAAMAIAGAWRGAGTFPAQMIAELRSGNPALEFERVARGLTGLAERNPREGSA